MEAARIAINKLQMNDVKIIKKLGNIVLASDGFFPFQFTLDRIYTATDLCGNSTVDTMTISVIDTVAPTWVFLPPDTTILCDQWEDYTIIQPIVEDNCDPAPEGPGGGGATDTTITEGAIDTVIAFLLYIIRQ